MKTWQKLALLLVALSLCCCGSALFFPVKIPCGKIGYTCLPAPDPNGFVSVYYEVEPLGITVIETVLGTNLRVAYSKGYDRRKIR
jgi:hypothetical protein